MNVAFLHSKDAWSSFSLRSILAPCKRFVQSRPEPFWWETDTEQLRVFHGWHRTPAPQVLHSRADPLYVLWSPHGFHPVIPISKSCKFFISVGGRKYVYYIILYIYLFNYHVKQNPTPASQSPVVSACAISHLLVAIAGTFIAFLPLVAGCHRPELRKCRRLSVSQLQQSGWHELSLVNGQSLTGLTDCLLNIGNTWVIHG